MVVEEQSAGYIEGNKHILTKDYVVLGDLKEYVVLVDLY